jgi:hypothetical protein
VIAISECVSCLHIVLTSDFEIVERPDVEGIRTPIRAFNTYVEEVCLEIVEGRFPPFKFELEKDGKLFRWYWILE